MGSYKEVAVICINSSERMTVGSVQCPVDATFAIIRQEIEICELVPYSFHFILLGSVLTEKQEARWQVRETKVHIQYRGASEQACKRQRLDNGVEDSTCDVLDESPEAGIDEVQDCESNNESRLEARKKQELYFKLAETQLKSKLVSRSTLVRWQYEAEKVREKLRSKGRADNFEVYTRDEGGSVVIKIWCTECGRTYGSGKDPVTSSSRTLSNFEQSHIRSATHRAAYAANHGVEPVPLVATVKKTHKEEIEAAMLEVSNFNSSYTGASFEIVQLTLGNFSNKHHVFMRCTLDDQWLHLVPICGSTTETMMLHHIHSSTHRAAMSRKAQSKSPDDGKGSVGVVASTPKPGYTCQDMQCKGPEKLEFEESSSFASESQNEEEFDSGDGSESGDGDGSGGLSGDLVSCSASEVDTSPESPFTATGAPEASALGSDSRRAQEEQSRPQSSDLCWGLWQPEIEVGGTLWAVKDLLADEKGGADWWAEPQISASISSKGQEYHVLGCFRHRKCERICQGTAEPFPNLCCFFCQQIPKCADFLEKAIQLSLAS